jgi:geranylgeranyl pyrophosphate synthase
VDDGHRIEQALAAALADHPEGELVRAARYATLGGGHCWRGRMALLAGRAFRADADACALPLAAAVEMMHAASLVLDDLPSMDNAATRRGKACVHLVFPDWAVDLLPAFLVNRAYRTVADAEAAPAECRIRALRLLGELGGELAAGQEADLALARKKASAAELLDCYARKSGALFAAALAGGALLCGADEAAAGDLRAAGIRLGQAYQLLDDVADGPEEDGAYREAGRYTAYALFGPENAGARAEALLAEAARTFARLGPAAEELRGLLERMRGR